MTWLYSVIAGLLIAVVYACATWMGFQCRKQGTLLPRGLIVEKYGALISMLLYGICGIALIVSGFLLGPLLNNPVERVHDRVCRDPS